MVYYLSKVIITALLVVLIAEISKRSTLIGSILASVPLISVLAMVWLYIDTQSTQKVTQLAHSIFWLIIPSLTLFITLPLLIKRGMGFYPSMTLSIGMTIVAYYLMVLIVGKMGIRL